jgi:ubiquinol-cytochrome c reductase cytochrome b subunit
VFVLGLCGGALPDDEVIPGAPSFMLFDGQLNSYLWLTRVATLAYFAYFFIVLPLLGPARETAAGAAHHLRTGAVPTGGRRR